MKSLLLADRDLYTDFKSKEGTRAEYLLFREYREDCKSKGDPLPPAHANDIPKSCKEILLNGGHQNLDQLSVPLDGDDERTKKSTDPNDGFRFLLSDSPTGSTFGDKHIATIPVEVKSHPTKDQLVKTVNRFMTEWKPKNKWGSIEPRVDIVAPIISRKDHPSDLFPEPIFRKMQWNEHQAALQTTLQDMNASVFKYPFVFRNPETVLGRTPAAVAPSDGTHLNDLDYPLEWVRKRLPDIIKFYQNDDERVIGITSSTGSGKMALIAKACKTPSRDVLCSVAVFPVIEICTTFHTKYHQGRGDSDDIWLVNSEHTPGKIGERLETASTVDARRALPTYSICKATLRERVHEIVKMARLSPRQIVSVIIDEAHTMNDALTLYRLLRQPNIKLVLVTATVPGSWSFIEHPPVGNLWKEIDGVEEEDVAHVDKNGSLAQQIPEEKPTPDDDCENRTAVDEVTTIAPLKGDFEKILKRLLPGEIVKSNDRYFEAQELDLSRFFNSMRWLQGLTPKENVDAGNTMPFKFVLVDQLPHKTLLDSILDYLCRESGSNNVIIQASSIPEVKGIYQALSQRKGVNVFKYTSDDSSHKSRKQRDEFVKLCKKNMNGALGQNVLASVNKLRMGADIPEVDTVLTTQKAISNSNIDEAQKILQSARHTRCHPNKRNAKMIMFNAEDTRKALGLFVYTYDPDMTVTDIFRFKRGQNLSFEDAVRASVPDEDLHSEIGRIVGQLRIKNAPAPPFALVFPCFLSHFAERAPSSGETFELGDPNIAPQNGTKWMTKIVNYLRNDLIMLDDAVRKKVDDIEWLMRKVLTPKPLQHLVQPCVKPQGYDDWLKNTASPCRISAQDLMSFCEKVMNQKKSGRVERANMLCDDGGCYTFNLKPKLIEEGKGKTKTVVLDKTRGGIFMNQDLFEVAAEINSKIGYDETGNGAMRSFAAKLIIYQLRDMAGSMYNTAWYERRIADVNEYRKKIKQRNEYIAARKKRKRDDDVSAKNAKRDKIWKMYGFIPDSDT